MVSHLGPKLLLVGLILIAIFVALTVFTDVDTGVIISQGEIEYFDERFEVVEIYRIYDGIQLAYGVDYDVNGTTLTLIAPNKYNSNSITVHSSTDAFPINESYLICEQGWLVHDGKKQERYYGVNHYRLYVSDDTPIMGTSTHISKAKTADLHAVVIPI